MSASGGAALAAGIWYQSVIALAFIVEEWTFDRPTAPTPANCAILTEAQKVTGFLEYFDMDYAQAAPEGLQLIQCKVSNQEDLSPFSPGEIREIFDNATRAILRHRRNSVQPVTGFVLASNRPPGAHLQALEKTLQSVDPTADMASYMKAVGAASVPADLFILPKAEPNGGTPATTDLSSSDPDPAAEEQTRRTFADLARNLTRNLPKELGSYEERVEACLTALAHFTFARANPQRLVEALERWLSTWGILPQEYQRHLDSLLGALYRISMQGSSFDAPSVMQQALGSPNALPLAFGDIGSQVIRELRGYQWPDLPTPRLSDPRQTGGWMLERTGLLRGLPHGYEEDTAPSSLDALISSTYPNEEPPRIFALVGPGGVGKSGLMARLFNSVGEGLWDWDAEVIRHDERFIGYPLLLPAVETAFQDLEGVIARWAERTGNLSDPVHRCAVANGITPPDPALWIGLDGLDELPDLYLVPLARKISSFAAAQPQVRIVLTTRGLQYELIEKVLNTRGLLRCIPVAEFGVDEAAEAVFRATEGGLQLPSDGAPTAVGTRTELNKASSERNELVDSSRQPLFVGVLRLVYSQPGGLAIIQAAYEDDSDAWTALGETFIHVFCDRVHRRLNNPNVTRSGVFCAVQQLAREVGNPALAAWSDWERVCQDQLDGFVSANAFAAQCAASGLIRDRRGAAYEWRHARVGRYLPRMKASREWQ